jgi:hypothetical protein
MSLIAVAGVSRAAEPAGQPSPTSTAAEEPAEKAAPLGVRPSASHAYRNDGHGGNPLAALADDKEPAASGDQSIPRFTFWSHRGTTEWVQYELDRLATLSSVEVYWFDDRPRGGCRVPKAWKLFYRAGYEWLPIEQASSFGVAQDKYNRTTFKPVKTDALRIVVEQQPGMSSGMLQWKLNGRSPRTTTLGHVGPDADDFDLQQRLESQMILDFAANANVLANERAAEATTALERHVQLAAERRSIRARLNGSDANQARERIEQLRRTDAALAALYEQLDGEGLVKEVFSADADACLRLLVRLDWLDQDAAGQLSPTFAALAAKVIGQLEPADEDLKTQRSQLAAESVPANHPRWLRLYGRACERRRAARLKPHRDALRRIVFTKHHDLGGQHYAYTEDVSDSPYNDNNPFEPSAKLCLLETDGLYGSVRVLIDEPEGIIRDPDVSYDGRRILFAWRKSMTDDDYHLYEMQADDGAIRQLTAGPGVADYEPAYLPSGEIIFNSTRCQQIVDCWWADVSNLFTCDAEGRYLRRLSFDQVHTNYPQVMPDGRVIYTRWDYNDRGQLFPQPLFQMNPDGTGQREFYGNNSWFPTTILHARGIPGTQKVVCVLSGHHTYQKGKLAIIDPRQGTQENSGVQLIAPRRETPAVKVDCYGYEGHQFQYPWPLEEDEFLVTFCRVGSLKPRQHAEEPFGVYWIDAAGNRELLVGDPTISCNQAVPLAPRERPPVVASRVDYRQTAGTYFLQDIYRGPGLAGMERGTVKQLRVVALEFRAAGVGHNGNRGPAGGALVSTPISINGAWDVKRVLGTTPVYDDGSAAFLVPARTPVYFQALDERGHVVQTMRSWSTLQPGEEFSCVGCHETKNSPPALASNTGSEAALTEAMRAGPQPLRTSAETGTGFSFPKLIQPILDRHCVKCHNRKAVEAGESKISLEGTGTLDKKAAKRWSDAYKTLADPKHCSWTSPQSEPTLLPPYHAGAAKSPLLKRLAEGHEGVELSAEEMRLLACWIDLAVPFGGTYTEAMDPSRVETYRKYLEKRRAWEAEEAENIEALIRATPGE